VRRFINLLVVLGFVAGVATPLVANLRGQDGADPEAENRTLAPFPTLAAADPKDGHRRTKWEALTSYLPGLDEWFADHFGYRAWLVRWYGESRYFGLGVSPVSTVVKGRDGWLFYAEDGGLDDFTNEKPLSPWEIENWRRTIVRARDWCRSQGIAYVFTIPPDKHVVYPEQFDPTIRQVSPVSRTDQVMTATLDTGVVVDVRQAVMSGKKNERLYHVTDTHWNQRGAFLAYQQLITAIGYQVPGVGPAWQRADFEPTSRTILGQDLAGMMGLKRSLHEEDLRLMPKRKRQYVVVEPAGAYATSGEGRIVTEIPGSTLPRAVMFRDSFTSWLAPFLSEHFSRIVYLWQNDFDADVVLKEHPDVVIQEIVGRHLYNFMPTPSLIPDAKN
jgi:hypothetical protein